MHKRSSRASITVLCVVVATCSSSPPISAPSTAPAEDWSGFGELENVLRWTPEQQLRGYRNMDKIYPTRPIPASHDPYSLPERLVDVTGWNHEFEGTTYDLAGFLVVLVAIVVLVALVAGLHTPWGILHVDVFGDRPGIRLEERPPTADPSARASPIAAPPR